MNELSAIQKKYCSQALLAAVFIAAACIAAGARPLGKGLLLGTLFSVLNFVLIGHSLPFQINKDRVKTFLFCLGGIGFRHAILALPLVIAAKSEAYSFIAAAAGLFMVQTVLMVHHVGRVIAGRKQD